MTASMIVSSAHPAPRRHLNESNLLHWTPQDKASDYRARKT